MHRLLAVVAALVAALALAACGGGDEDKAMSKDEYKKEAQRINDASEGDFETALKTAQSKDPDEALTGVRQIGTTVDEAVTKFEGLEPPEEYKAIHGRYVGALRTVGDRADAVEQAAEQKDRARIEQSLSSFQQSLVDGAKTGDEFDKQVGTT